jgi:hypothetical protein
MEKQMIKERLLLKKPKHIIKENLKMGNIKMSMHYIRPKPFNIKVDLKITRETAKEC